MTDWIDDIKAERGCGINRALDQRQHAAVNGRHPGCTLEYCCECGEPTGRAGRHDDSLFAEDGSGPYCEGRWDAAPATKQADEIDPAHAFAGMCAGANGAAVPVGGAP